MNCKRRFTTLETSTFQVVKKSGVVQPFSREKVVAGVRRACQGRPVTEDQLALLAQQVEESLRSTGASNVSTDEVGRAILPFLRELDEVAYLRFASVYQGFNSLDDFAEAIDALRREHAGKNGDTSADTVSGAERAVSSGAGGADAQSSAGSDSGAAVASAAPKPRTRRPRKAAAPEQAADTLPF